MEAGENCHGLVAVDKEHQRVGKCPEQGSSNIPMNDRKLMRVRADAIDDFIKGGQKTAA